jgi:catechol 2,3-dioxygenase-like lactoylglutathione lyase family enzyme
VSGPHHVTAIAGNPLRNPEFYRRTLGLRLVKRTVNFDDPGTYHFYYGDETVTATRPVGWARSSLLPLGACRERSARGRRAPETPRGPCLMPSIWRAVRRCRTRLPLARALAGPFAGSCGSRWVVHSLLFCTTGSAFGASRSRWRSEPPPRFYETMAAP